MAQVEMAPTVEDPVFGLRHAFRRTTGDDGTEVLHVDTWIDPGGGVTPHVHPGMEERFTVIEGRPQFLAGRRWAEASAGEEILVPAGTRHAFRNRSGAVARVRCEARPASTLQGFLEDVAGLSRAGKLTKAGLPKPGGLLEAAVLVEGYRDMVVLGFPSPPPAIQRLVFPPLARIAARRGLRPGSFAALR